MPPIAASLKNTLKPRRQSSLQGKQAITAELRSCGPQVAGIIRQLGRRARRRYQVGRAYDMAREIARHVKLGSQVVDVGCGNGFTAHHLSALLQRPVFGVDVMPTVSAPIVYKQFDGLHLPFAAASQDAVLLCYVLHHCANPAGLLADVCRVLRPGGRAIVYEDVPESWFDRLLCWRHERDWRFKGGPCAFLPVLAWQGLFATLGFRTLAWRALSRLRDPTNPVRRSMLVLERSERS